MSAVSFARSSMFAVLSAAEEKPLTFVHCCVLVIDPPQAASTVLHALDKFAPLTGCGLSHLRRIRKHFTDGKLEAIVGPCVCSRSRQNDSFDDSFDASVVEIDDCECADALPESLRGFAARLALVPEFAPLDHRDLVTSKAANDKSKAPMWPLQGRAPHTWSTPLPDSLSDDEVRKFVRGMRFAAGLEDEDSELDNRRRKTNRTFSHGAAIMNSNGVLLAVVRDCRERSLLAHATMVAIEAVASQQRAADSESASTLGHSRKRSANVKNGKECADTTSTKYDRDQYICSGCTLFVTREPCTMCAMAGVHARFARVVFHETNLLRGALAHGRRLHTVGSLNHRYEVYGGCPLSLGPAAEEGLADNTRP